MAAYLNAVATAPNAQGVVVGTAGSDRISGTSGDDRLSGGKGVDYLYGGAGNDTFIFKLSDFDAALHAAPQDYVYDFGGAGCWATCNNDFLAFVNFGAGSTLTYDAEKSALAQSHNGGDPTLQYYTIHSANTGLDYELFVHSTNGKLLGASDYAFYG